MTNIIETHALGKSYGQTKALHDCTLAIPEGHVVALVGPNGAGKTTLLNLAVGLAVPTSGEVTVLGGRPAGSPSALDGIAFVAQNTPLYKNLSAADLIHETRNLNRRFDQRYADAAPRRARNPTSAEGGGDVRRPAGPARVDAGARPKAAAPRARRADGLARSARPDRFHGDGDGSGRGRRPLGCVVLPHPRGPRAGLRLPRAAFAWVAFRWSGRSTISSPTTVSSPVRSRSTSAMRRTGTSCTPATMRRGFTFASAATAPPIRSRRDGRHGRSPWRN